MSARDVYSRRSGANPRARPVRLCPNCDGACQSMGVVRGEQWWWCLVCNEAYIDWPSQQEGGGR